MNKFISWNDYFLSLAKLSALRSKDPNTQVGACIVNELKRVVALGYNGMPLGDDIAFPWTRDAQKTIDNKYAYVIHAELNAILNATQKLNNCSLYVSLFPCANCAKALAQSGIKKIFYEDDKYENTEDDLIAKRIFDNFSIQYEKIESHVEIKIK